MAITTFSGALEAMRAMGLPDAALIPIESAWNTAFKLITENNERIAQINAAKAQDPNNTEYIDSLWKAHYQSDPKMVEKEAEFQAVTAEYERLLSELREFGKTKIQAPLSEDEAKKAKAAVAESKDAIETARATAAAMVTMIDSMLESQKQGIEGGLMSLMPEADSLKNARGRKAGGNSGASYKTRVKDVTLNGESTNVNGKGKLDYAADKLSEMFGAATHPENRVTAETLEEELFKAIGVPFRSKKSTEIPETVEFDFTKDITTGEGKTEKRTVKVKVFRYETPKSEKADAPAESKPAETKTEANGAEAPKVSNDTATPAKKVAANAPKK